MSATRDTRTCAICRGEGFAALRAEAGGAPFRCLSCKQDPTDFDEGETQ